LRVTSCVFSLALLSPAPSEEQATSSRRGTQVQRTGRRYLGCRRYASQSDAAMRVVASYTSRNSATSAIASASASKPAGRRASSR
jgi:hypothetical protein